MPLFTLHSAVQTEDLTLVKKLIENDGEDIDAIDNKSRTALYLSCRKNTPASAQITQYLLENGARFDIAAFTNKQGDEIIYAIHAAAGSGNLRALNLLLEHGDDVNRRTGKYQQTPLFTFLVTKQNHLGALNALLEAGTDLTVEGSSRAGEVMAMETPLKFLKNHPYSTAKSLNVTAIVLFCIAAFLTFVTILQVALLGKKYLYLLSILSGAAVSVGIASILIYKGTSLEKKTKSIAEMLVKYGANSTDFPGLGEVTPLADLSERQERLQVERIQRQQEQEALQKRIREQRIRERTERERQQSDRQERLKQVTDQSTRQAEQKQEFSQKLEALKISLTKLTPDSMREMNESFQQLESEATTSRRADFFSLRGQFYEKAAANQTHFTTQTILYDKASQDYQQAIYFDPFIPDVSNYISDLASKIAAPSLSQVMIPMEGFSPLLQPTVASGDPLSAEQRRQVEEIKARLRQETAPPPPISSDASPFPV